MSNVFRANEISEGGVPVVLPLKSGVAPRAAEDAARRRIEIQDRIMREAKRRAHRAVEERDETTRLTREDADRAIAEARERAEAIVAGARAEAGRIEAEARAKGLEAARVEALATAMKEIEEALGLVNGIAGDLRGLRGDFFRAAADGMLALIETLLRRIVRAGIRLDRDLVRRTIEAAAAEIAAADRITVRIHPEDLDVAVELRAPLMERIAGLADVIFTPDEGISRGGAIIETAFGRVDARLESQIEELLREARAAVEFLPEEETETETGASSTS
jgi:flagellar assembly protein FliH